VTEEARANRLAINAGDTLQVGGPSENLLKVVKRTRGGWVVQPHGADTTHVISDLDLVIAYHERRLQSWACDLEGLDERRSAKMRSAFDSYPPHCQRECLRRLAFVEAIDAVRDSHRSVDAAAKAIVPEVWARMSSEWQDREREAATAAAAKVRHREGVEADAEPVRMKVVKEPKSSTAKTWYSAWSDSGRNEMVLMPDYEKRGYREPRYPVAKSDDEKDTYQLMEEAAKGAYLDLMKRSKQVAYEFYGKLCKASNIPQVASRTFRRFLKKQYDAYDRCVKREGKKAAWLKFGIFVLRDLPDRPLEEVEVDHCLVDLIVVDENGRAIGRPWITVLLDRATKCIVGIHVSFLPPSYMTIQRALAHSMYEKDLSAFPGLKNDWPCFGLVEWLISDRGKEFLSRSFRTAGLVLDVYAIALPGRKPWLKAAVERIFRTLHVRVFDLQEGSTKAWNPDTYNSAKRAKVPRPEFDRLLVEWIVDDYHQTPHPALLRKYGREMAPQEAWEMLVERYGVRFAPNPDHAFRITGEIFERKILSTGIHIKNQIYVDEALLSRLLRRNGAKERYWTFRRDRADLGRIWILVEGEGWQEIRNIDYALTNGVSEQQYAIWKGDAVAHLQHGEEPCVEDLAEARLRVEALRQEALEGGTTLATALKWARYGDMSHTFTPVPGFGAGDRQITGPAQALLPGPVSDPENVEGADEIDADDTEDADVVDAPPSNASLVADIDAEALRLIQEMQL
jgi:putative transposase